MKKTILLFGCFLGMLFSAVGQVWSIKYLVEYNDVNELYDCKIVVAGGEATTYPQRIQFNSQYSIVVPTGSKFEIVERYFPLIDNQFYMGTSPCMWEIGSSVIAPLFQSESDFYSVIPDLSTIPSYNNLMEGDTVLLFSISSDVNPCENAIRPFDNVLDSNDGPPFGGDFSNGFTIGSIGQLYTGNILANYGTFQLETPIEMCVGSTSSFYPGIEGMWVSDNPGVATVDQFTGSITAFSGGTAILTFTDMKTSCTTDFDVVVFEEPLISIDGSSELCIQETSAVSPSTGGVWTSSNPSIVTVDNFGTVTGISEGNATLSYTEITTLCTSSPLAISVLASSDPSCLVATEDLASSIFRVFPNPANDFIDIEGDSPIESIEIYSMSYQKIDEKEFTSESNNVQLSLERLDSGMYFLLIESNNKRFYKKLIVE